MITQDRLKEVMDYDPNTGVFRWKDPTRRKKLGSIAGSNDGRGYRLIGIDGRKYKAHRLAWLYVYGMFPEHQIDHKNGHRSDNRLINLRPATNSQNLANTRPRRNGLKGCWYSKMKNRWMAKIMKDSRKIHIGYFKTEIEAHEAYMEAAKKLFGDFARAA